MSEIKAPATRIHVGRGTSTGLPGGKFAPLRPGADLPARPGDAIPDPQRRPVGSALVSDFIAPPRETAEWLGNPAMTATLAAVSADLAPGGVAASKRDQYAASVVETHLAARRQLARHLNALLRA